MRLLLILVVMLTACAGPSKPVKGPPVFGTNEALEAELAAVNSDLSQADALIRDARARIKQYQNKKGSDARNAVIGAEAEIHNHELHKQALIKRKRQLEAQIQRGR